MTERIYFTGIIEPQTSELEMWRITQEAIERPAPLRIDVRFVDVDPANADPTLAAFYEARAERKDGE